MAHISPASLSLSMVVAVSFSILCFLELEVAKQVPFRGRSSTMALSALLQLALKGRHTTQMSHSFWTHPLQLDIDHH